MKAREKTVASTIQKHADNNGYKRCQPLSILLPSIFSKNGPADTVNAASILCKKRKSIKIRLEL